MTEDVREIDKHLVEGKGEKNPLWINLLPRLADCAAGLAIDLNHLSSNLGVVMSEGCFIFYFASLG